VRTDISSTSMSALDQSFAFKQLQGTADRDPGEFELFTKGVLGRQFLAWRQFAGLNHVTNLRRDLAVACSFKAHGGTESPLARNKSSLLKLTPVSKML
jgi:hypothetical protein